MVKTTGDGTLSEFESTLDAMQAALEIQSAMVRQNVGRPENKLVLLRVGLVVGDVSPDGEDIMGDSVNLAARLQAAVPAENAIRPRLSGRISYAGGQ
ncbi:MAG: hypothetical protein Q8K93_25610 [Reyranella sp.]|uniref:hypothetical protein n=1 Tax=Reyranella sp. TaxID=1929291 RepID=UPI002730616E|nr:hypothetical protein [Reyranella sp.]MDP1965572.1 hypothetical protein [Reyranella sp.]MDP2374008.1 hypothetical protein [Reyranella sp.]